MIFDLDGTLISTETLVIAVARDVLKRYGKDLTAEAISASIGRRPLDAWQAVVDVLDLSSIVTAQRLFDESEPLLTERWHEVPLLPGAQRVVQHLQSFGIRLGLATSTSRDTMHKKLMNKKELLKAFDPELIVCGDDENIRRGKPAPDLFLRVASLACVEPSECLVFEDAPSGVIAALEAGMRVVAIPSIRDQAAFPKPGNGSTPGILEIIPSLLSWNPEIYHLPKFSDPVVDLYGNTGVIPLEAPLKIKGIVVAGFGRGSKELGIPTANIDSKSVKQAFAEMVTGIFCGWASIGKSNDVYPTVLSIGWNPVFANDEKTCEPWILHDFKGQDFRGDQLRLIIAGYIRPESNFPSLQDLIERIYEDAEVAKRALKHSTSMANLRNDAFLAYRPAQ